MTDVVGSRCRRKGDQRVIGPKPRVLIVDDEPAVRDFVDKALRQAGYTTVRAVDGEDALALADVADQFDLLLTDVVMPHMNGPEVARYLRLVVPDLKVLYLTGYVDQLFLGRELLPPEEAFIEKPVSVAGLLEAVSLLLNGAA